ncbi:MAG TPA: 2-oxoacid:acceptor oxidoreductase subunit alpha [bacterium]|nr:2-oxoacid:acceptor oxidoreductase subunit alpha [bacterium]
MAHLNIVLAGAAGQGVQSAAEILGKTLQRLGYHVYTTQDYQSRVRGGHNFMRIRFSDRPLLAAVKPIDYLLALNEESLDIHLPQLTANGLALCMVEDQGDTEDARLRALSEDVGPTAAKGAKFVGVKLLSMLMTAIGFSPEVLKESVKLQFGKRLKPEVLQANLDAIEAVARSMSAADIHPLPFAPAATGEHLFVTGNECITLGMIAAGVGVYAGYPMTPSTSILNFLAGAGPSAGIAVEQVEDEIAALNLAVGAAYAGARAAAGSSGAGMCLMSEAIGLAGITETPVVVVDAQRASPAVGMATRTEQSDLLFMCHASQGEFARAVLAPALHEDGFYLAAEAFNLADRWQTPVILMDDMAYADAIRTVDEFDLSPVTIDRGAIAPEPDDVSVLRRFEPTATGVSPRAFPVLSKWLVAVDSHEHDEVGHLTDNIENRNRQHAKRLRKLAGLAAEMPGPEIVGDADGTLLLCWGSTAGPLLEGAQRLRDQGHNVGVAIFRYLYPMNVEKIVAALSSAKRLLTVEGNELGQLGRLLRMETGLAVDGHIAKTDGRIFTVDDIVELVESRLGGER